MSTILKWMKKTPYSSIVDDLRRSIVSQQTLHSRYAKRINEGFLPFWNHLQCTTMEFTCVIMHHSFSVNFTKVATVRTHWREDNFAKATKRRQLHESNCAKVTARKQPRKYNSAKTNMRRQLCEGKRVKATALRHLCEGNCVKATARRQLCEDNHAKTTARRQPRESNL